MTHIKAADHNAAYELYLYANNDARIYTSIIKTTIANLAKKYSRGVYDEEKAVVAWVHVMDAAAKLYAHDFGGIWYNVFGPATREEAGRLMLEYWEEEIKAA